MKVRPIFDTLLDQVRDAYQGSDDTLAFAAFPDDVRAQPVESFQPKCAEVFAQESKLQSGQYPALTKALFDAGPVAKWRETYKDTDIGADFMNRFGCYAIIGEGGPFLSDHLWAWMVYMPAGLYYPWHHHPGEEMYLVIAGNAVFMRAETPDERHSEGAAIYHASNQPHAMETLDDPVLCLVFWRNGFETAPVLTPR